MAGPGPITSNQEKGNIQALTPELQRIYYMAIQAEHKPIEQIQARKENDVERNKLLTDLIGKVDKTRELIPHLNTPLSLREITVASGDDKIITGTADKSIADLGKHSIEVLETATGARALSNRFEDRDRTRVGSGYFVFNTADGNQKEVFIDNASSTLEGIARIINGAGMGIRASVVNDQSDPDAPFRLLMTAEGVGAKKDVDFPEFYFLDGDSDFYIEEKKPATNAKIRYQGLDIESPSNEIKDVIPGVTLNIKGITEPGKPIGVSIEQDIGKTSGKMKDLVDKLNDVLGFIQQQNKMDENTPSYKTLGGDYSIRMSESRLRDALIANSIDLDNPRTVRILSDIGVMFNKKGTLDFDQKKFENAINQNFGEVADLLTGDGLHMGIVNRLSNALNSMNAPGVGLLSNQKQTYTERIRRFDQQIEEKEKRAEKKADDLRDKLARIQGAFNQLQGQSKFFAGMDSNPLMQATSHG